VPAGSASTFDIYPAIDLRDGRVVRLREGDFTREQVYDDDPVRVARGFAEQGASWIHIVDLDGARAGERRQTGIVGSIVAAFGDGGPRFQIAGGLRTVDAVDDVLASGATRVVIGTAALRDPGFARDAILRHGADRIAIALDVREGLAVGDGWVPGASGVPLAEALEHLSSVGVETFVVTAIDRDGLLGGPDLALLQECARATDAAVIASGGIRSIADLEAARRIACAGAIVGRAIYDGTLDLAAAIAAIAAIGGPAV
jgi:phosphoribosylformimino-5-aminoimidazole carboxamide ribotide isomerase